MNNKILIIDDDEGILDALTLVLEEVGFTIGSTLKGYETFQKVDKFKPDLILLDVLVSGKDGREICKVLKTTESTKNIPIIMISAHPSAKETVDICGANDFLAKPFEIKELLTRIKKQISF